MAEDKVERVWDSKKLFLHDWSDLEGCEISDIRKVKARYRCVECGAIYKKRKKAEACSESHPPRISQWSLKNYDYDGWRRLIARLAVSCPASNAHLVNLRIGVRDEAN